ncbi:MAG: hypothetical protein J5846_01005 [Desulfovibrio sp.]|nr:hypothetical protein [Desulfovibrio sp.]
MMTFIRKTIRACSFLALLFCLPAAQALADVSIDAKHFPDAKFQNWLKENVAGGKSVLSKKQIAALEEMDISYSEISNLKGLEHFTALKELTCWSNNLSTIDVSKNPTLEILRCNGNELSALDLSKNKALKVLACDQNKLKTLDLSGLPDLRALACRYNELTALDLSHNAALTELDCWGNELTSLDLSKNLDLTKLNCLENPIKTLDLSKNINLSEAALPATATVTLPGGDKILMADFKVVKASDGKNRLDLSKYGDKITDISVEPEGVDEEIAVSSSKGVHSFASCDGKVKISYALGKDRTLDLILFVEKQ